MDSRCRFYLCQVRTDRLKPECQVNVVAANPLPITEFIWIQLLSAGLDSGQLSGSLKQGCGSPGRKPSQRSIAAVSYADVCSSPHLLSGFVLRPMPLSCVGFGTTGSENTKQLPADESKLIQPATKNTV